MASYKVKCQTCNAWRKSTNKRELDNGGGACKCNSLDYAKHKKIGWKAGRLTEPLEEEKCLEIGDDEEFKFTIYGNPKVKKNSQRIVMKGIRPSIAYELWAGQCMYQIQKELSTYINFTTLSGPIHMEAHYYRNTKVRADLSNLHEGVQDCLTAMGFWLDDSLIESHDGSRKHYDKDNPRIEITIKRYVE